jgi:hypothetical protein
MLVRVYAPAGRETYLAFGPTWVDLPLVCAPILRPFVLLVAGDARAVRDSELQQVAACALQIGAAYICCWGPDASRVEDAFDDAAVLASLATDPESPDGETGIMTTQHESEPLAEAVWFASTAACTNHIIPLTCPRSLVQPL